MRVTERRLRALVPERLADFGQRPAHHEQIGAVRVTEVVRAQVRDPRSPQKTLPGIAREGGVRALRLAGEEVALSPQPRALVTAADDFERLAGERDEPRLLRLRDVGDRDTALLEAHPVNLEREDLA